MATDAQAAADLAQERTQESFQQREWLTQRVGWMLLAACLVAACAGVFGGGAIAKRTLTAGENYIELDRFARRHSPARWRIVAKRTYSNYRYVVRISSNFLERYEIRAITPEPMKSSISARDVVFEFSAAQADGTIVFMAEPQQIGFSEGELRLGDSAPLRVSQLVYP